MSETRSSNVLLFVVILVLPASMLLKPFLSELDFIKYFNVDSKARWSVDIKAVGRGTDSSTVRVKIINEGKYGFKDLKVECDAKGQSGTVIRSIDHTFYRVFNGRGEYYGDININNFPDQTHSLECQATDLEVVSREACMISSDGEGNAIRSDCKQVEL